MPPLCHALYTNAFGRRGQGFRHLFVAPEWPSADRRRVGAWLETLQPRDETAAEEKLAVNAFRLGGTLHACLARLDADFARDEHGRRGGRLVHALLLPLDEDRPADDFTGALLAASRAFERPAAGDADRLEAYLERCRAASEIRVEAVDLESVRALEADFLIRFYAFSSGASRAVDAVFGPAAAPLADALVVAAGGLPPRLRLACRWATGLRATPETSFVARRVREGERLAALPEGPGRAYADWLRAGGAAPRDWDVRSWDALMERIS